MEDVVPLSIEDIRAVMAVVRTACDHWDDPRVWRECVLQGACDLMAGCVGSISAQTLASPDQFGKPMVLAVVGMPDAIMEKAVALTEDERLEDAESRSAMGIIEIFGRFQKHGWATVARGQVVEDAAYYASAFHRNFRSQAGCDDYVMSVRSVDEPTRVEIVTIDRPPGAPRFGLREVAILKLLHDEISMLVGVRLATEDHLSRDGLSKRLRETLQVVLEGRSEKEIAQQLGLSVATIHQYIGMLYRHFRVQTRAELMSYFISRTPKMIPTDGD